MARELQETEPELLITVDEIIDWIYIWKYGVHKNEL
jgi:hypothetical protein